ncbi:MAG: LacI family DNA-binding transcriptional regulator [Thermoleophilaceae bacterium]
MPEGILQQGLSRAGEPAAGPAGDAAGARVAPRSERIRDVAEHAGVSPATVSRVLNGVGTVREDYRRRVVDAIAELGYRPNRLARNLRRQNAEMIGVVVSDIENPHFTQMVRAVEDGAFRNGYRMLLCNTDEAGDKQRAYLEMLAGERVLGVILSPSNPAGDEIGWMLDLAIPIVAFDRAVADPRADSVVSDGEGAARTATEHLMAAGHRRIAFIGGPAGIETADTRRAGYEAAMRAEGQRPREGDGGFRIDGGRHATEELLEHGGEVSALVVANNLMAIGALEALAQHGRRVPDDMALVAIDDPFWAELVEPPLTVLAQPVRDMADTAMRLLLGRIAGRPRKPRHEVFPLELRVRGSCGSARVSEGAER